MTKIEKASFGALTRNAFCKDLNSNICCIHNDEDKILRMMIKIKVKDEFYRKEFNVSFCPFCGFAYQKENREGK
ncbi:MAG: hypothetical protein IMZ64_05140 [Bacteroidetes bacterium]|nr:hypothetical protein [Bacteroidota bacterium]